MKIITLEARLWTAEERHRVTVDTTRADRERLAEAKYLIESVRAAAADYLSHPIFRRKPNASHMCARIKISHI
jgi:hypothetical protein